MTRHYLTISILLATIILFSQCKITGKNAYGLWVDALDTIELKSNNTFALRRLGIDDTVNITNNSSYEMTLKIYEGTWDLKGNILYFNFDNLKDQEKFGGCKTARLYKGFFRKSRIMTGASCKFPSKAVYYIKIN